MAIVIVQQSAASGWTGGSLTASWTLSGVTAGNLLVLAHGHSDTSNPNATVIVSDAQGTYTQDMFVRANSSLAVCAASLPNANAGSHTVSAVYQSGTPADSFGAGILLELSGVATSSYVDTSTPVSGSASTGTGPLSTSATGTLQAANDLLIAIIIHSAASAGATVPPSGYTEAYGMTVGSEAAYKQLTGSTASQTVSYGNFTNSQGWLVGLIAYKQAVAGGNKLLLLGNQGF